MIAALPLLLQAMDPAPAAPDERAPIIVTARPIEQTGKALADCLARRCSPAEDMAASIAHAENHFLSGEYEEALGVLGGSRRRNHREAARHPDLVAGLNRAYARISGHLGQNAKERIASINAVDALKAGLPSDDDRILVQRIEIGDMHLAQGRLDMGVANYRKVIKQARRANRPMIEGHAMLRLATIYAAATLVDQPAYARHARAAIADLQAAAAPEMAPFRKAGLLIAAQLAETTGDKGAIDRLIASHEIAPTERPLLLHAPSLEPEARPGRASPAGRVYDPYRADQWIDVTFWIEPDGSVTDPGVLRQSETLKNFWVAGVLEGIKARRYAPLAMRQLRVERYIRTANLYIDPGSRAPVRSPTPRIEMLDLTEEPRGGGG
jgi:hypothetical protein